jgi:hypothetical protein
LSNEVEIIVTSKDRTDFAAIGAKARTALHESVKDGLDDVEKTTTERFKEIGDHSGEEMVKSFDPHLTKWGDGLDEELDVKVKEKFRVVGEHGGESMAAGLRGSLSKFKSIGGDAGSSTATSFGKSLGDAAGVIKGAWIPMLIAALLPELPAIGALAATALVFAFGAGLAGLGLVAAWHLKSVQKEFGQFKKFLSGFMKDIGKPFEETWANIFNVAGNGLKKLQPILKGVFKDFVAPAVTSFVTKLGEAFSKLAPAIRPVAKAFSLLLGSIGKGLPGIFKGIADALSGMAGTISKNPDLFAGFITGMLKVVEGGLKVIDFLAKLFGKFADFLHTKNPFEAMAAALSPVLAILMHLGKAGDVFRAIGDAAKTIGPHIQNMFDKIKEKAGPILDKIGKQVKDELVPAFVDFMKAVAPLAGKLADIFTPTVVSAITDILDALSGLVDVLSGGLEIASGLFSGNWGRMWDGIKDVAKGGAKEAKAALESILNITTFGHGDKVIKFTLKAIDLASSAIHRVASAARGIKNKTVKLAQSGAAAVVSAVSRVVAIIRRFVGKRVGIHQAGAEAALHAVERVISAIKRFVGKAVKVRASVFGLGGVLSLIGAISRVVSKTVSIGARIFGLATGGIVGGQGMATGGVVGHAAEGGPRSNLTLVGERGAELVNLPRGSRVIPHGQSMQQLAGLGGGGGGASVIEIHSGGSRLDDLLLEVLRNSIRVKGGNVQVVLGRK